MSRAAEPAPAPAVPPADASGPSGPDPSPSPASPLASPAGVLVASDAASIFESGAATGDRPGHQVVLGLFVVLGLCVVTIFTIFALAVRPEDREWVPELTARYLYMPVVATSILVAIDAWRAGRRRWWVFLVTAPVPVINVVLAAMWLLRWRADD